jgi:DNA-binding response OmpR family regulator
VLDIDMPDVDGFKVAGELRAMAHCRRTRIAFHSAMDEEWVFQSFDDYDDFLPKPLAGAELVKRVGRLCSDR